MKLDIQLQAGLRAEDHQLEFPSGAPTKNAIGRITFRLDGEEREADCIEVAAGVYSILMNGQSHEVHVTTASADGAHNDNRWAVSVGTRNYVITVRDPRRRRRGAAGTGLEGPQEILAPMPGRIVKVLVKENQEVAQGTGLLVIEAMKMQNELRAPRSGRVEKIYVREATGVETGSKLMRLI
ncbi:MAG TPA: biotin/lipoyl-containing protein [Terriglobia bacterium]|nr:biotin/lipoyl-containing protein [Terriglobia bacterium]